MKCIKNVSTQIECLHSFILKEFHKYKNNNPKENISGTVLNELIANAKKRLKNSTNDNSKRIL